MIDLLFRIFDSLEKYSSRVTAFVLQPKFEILHSLPVLLFGAENISGLKPGKCCLRLGLIAVALAALASAFGRLFSDKAGWAFQEGKPMTIFSLILLFSVARLSEQIWKVRNPAQLPQPANPASLWWLLSWGFYIAAWDEILRLHETLDRQIHHLLGVRPNHISDHLDDLFVALYGVIGLYFLWIYRTELLHYTKSIFYFLAAALAGIFSVLIDTLGSDKPFLRLFVSNPADLQLLIDVLDITEECFKICAEILFIGLMLSVYRIALNLTRIIHENSAAQRV